jgi:hypothetical protein
MGKVHVANTSIFDPHSIPTSRFLASLEPLREGTGAPHVLLADCTQAQRMPRRSVQHEMRGDERVRGTARDGKVAAFNPSRLKRFQKSRIPTNLGMGGLRGDTMRTSRPGQHC